MKISEAFDKAKGNEYLFHSYNGRYYLKSEIKPNATEIEFFYAMSEEWEVKTQKQKDNGDF